MFYSGRQVRGSLLTQKRQKIGESIVAAIFQKRFARPKFGSPSFSMTTASLRRFGWRSRSISRAMENRIRSDGKSKLTEFRHCLEHGFAKGVRGNSSNRGPRQSKLLYSVQSMVEASRHTPMACRVVRCSSENGLMPDYASMDDAVRLACLPAKKLRFHATAVKATAEDTQ